MQKIIVLLMFCIAFMPVFATSPEYHVGIATSAGFFSWYTQVEAGFKVDLSPTVALGLTQRIAYGHTFEEILGMTEIRTYLFDDLFFHIGASYLVQESAQLQPDFATTMLPYLGFGLYIPIDRNRNFFLVPCIEMNQSFYLSDQVRPIYTDLPFIIAGQISLSCVYRIHRL